MLSQAKTSKKMCGINWWKTWHFQYNLESGREQYNQSNIEKQY